MYQSTFCTVPILAGQGWHCPTCGPRMSCASASVASSQCLPVSGFFAASAHTGAAARGRPHTTWPPPGGSMDRVAEPDLASPAFKADPYEHFALLRREAPVHRVRLRNGSTAWLVTR